jgi:hypothetical protein
VKRIFTLLLVLSFIYSVTDAQVITPIDSVYLNALTSFSKNVDKIKEKVWPGMQIGPFCIFRLNGPAFLLNHPVPPQNSHYLKDSIYILNAFDYGLMGATQTEINNYLTAHNDYCYKSYASINQFYAELFHELHHVYQRNYIKTLQFDNPADLLTYPEDYRNDAIKQYENEIWLLMLLGTRDNLSENINKVFTCRNIRKQIIGSKYLDYEKAVESAEGPATYCEYEYMQLFSSIIMEQEYINHRFYYSLTEPNYGRNGLRAKHLLTGMVQCLILSKYFKNWQPEYYASGLYLYDYFLSKFKPQNTNLPDLKFYEAKTKYFTALEKEKHISNLINFNNQNGIKVTAMFNEIPDFRGFDPMHAEAINDSMIIHYTLLRLGKGNNHFNLTNYRALSTNTDQIWFIKRVSFFVQENDIKLDENRLRCNNGTLDIDWKTVSQIRNGNEYLIKLE